MKQKPEFDFSDGFDKPFKKLLKCPDCKRESEFKCVEAVDVYRLLAEIKKLKQQLKEAKEYYEKEERTVIELHKELEENQQISDRISDLIRERDDYKAKVIKWIDEVFSEGWFNYFHTNYGVDDMDANDKMIEDIDKKVKELKQKLKEKK